MEHLADALQVNSGLEMLLLADNPFGDEGGQQLAEVLCNGNRSLRVLDIHGTRMTRAAEREVCSICILHPTFFLHAPSNTALHFKHVVNSLLRIT